jgi:hypothetical protein
LARSRVHFLGYRRQYRIDQAYSHKRNDAGKSYSPYGERLAENAGSFPKLLNIDGGADDIYLNLPIYLNVRPIAAVPLTSAERVAFT